MVFPFSSWCGCAWPGALRRGRSEACPSQASDDGDEAWLSAVFLRVLLEVSRAPGGRNARMGQILSPLFRCVVCGRAHRHPLLKTGSFAIVYPLSGGSSLLHRGLIALEEQGERDDRHRRERHGERRKFRLKQYAKGGVEDACSNGNEGGVVGKRPEEV